MKTDASAGLSVLNRGGNGSNTLCYEAVATLRLANRSVTHVVKSSNHMDYVGKTLTRRVRYEENENLLILTPEERMLGTAFALLWTPWNISSAFRRPTCG